MPSRVAISNLNATTIDIINTIRANASANYQSLVPEITKTEDLPRVGERLAGYPALANEFIGSMINRIALVNIKSATFNNAYAEFKKGYLEFGEVVEEVFVNLCKAREFSVEKAPAREFKRTPPDVRSVFHAENYKVQYPISIQAQELKKAFLSPEGVADMIARIIGVVTTSAEYDEYLLFKYLMIKAIAHGGMFPWKIGNTLNSAASAFRSASNNLTFINTKYNVAGVHTNTAREDQYIFMDSQFNADFDVNVLASAFNMDKANFIGKLKLIDDWKTFDNDRFSDIIEGSSFLEPITEAELAIMGKVKAVIIDREWFQIYDNLAMMSEQEVAAGLYWNYFYNVWKTVSSSPFSNAIVFVEDTADTVTHEPITVEVADIQTSEIAKIVTLTPDFEGAGLAPEAAEFVQTAEATEAGIAVHRYGAIIYPADALTEEITPEIIVGGVKYVAAEPIATNVAVGDVINFYREDYAATLLKTLKVDTHTVTLSDNVFAYGVTASAGSNTIKMTTKETMVDSVITMTKGDTAITVTEVDGEYTANITTTSGSNVFKIKVKGNVDGVEKVTTYTLTVAAS